MLKNIHAIMIQENIKIKENFFFKWKGNKFLDKALDQVRQNREKLNSLLRDKIFFKKKKSKENKFLSRVLILHDFRRKIYFDVWLFK